MDDLSFWWSSTSLRERLIALVAVTAMAVPVVGITVFAKTVPAMSCAAADDARSAATQSLNEARDGDVDAKCSAYRQIAGLLVRYQSDWHSCAPFNGKDAVAELDIQSNFYNKLVITCG